MKQKEVVDIIRIPDDCKAVIVGKTVEIRKRVRNKIDPRCKDCIHRVRGYTTAQSWYESLVCEMKPKHQPQNVAKGTKKKLFYSCNPYDKICEHFKDRSENGNKSM